MRHLMSPLDFSVEELDQLLNLAHDIELHPEKYAHACDGKKLATLFYEPSTRTRLSFEAAMLNLGGSVLGFSSAASSSASKGESVSDTIRMISCYADICAMRHPKEGAPMVASMASSIPVINAGDGGHQHPTQTLTDLLTIRSLKGRLNHFTIGLCGDLKFGRTVHSLVRALSRYEGVNFIFISPEELKVPDYIKEDVLEANIVLSLQILSNSANIDFLISIFSIAASTTKSQSAAKFISVVPDILERTTSFVASSIFPLATNLLKFLLIPANPLSTNSSFISLTITS